jgi:hypothetical protein
MATGAAADDSPHLWKPGQSGNPGGRPHGYKPFAPMLRQALLKTDRRNVSQMEKLVNKVVALAIAGDMDAVRWIADRTDGKVAQSIQVDSNQTVHVVPWLPYVQSAAEEALNGKAGEGLPQLEDAEVVTDRDAG